MKNKTLKLILTLCVIAIIFAVGIVGLFFYCLTPTDSQSNETIKFKVQSGATLRSVAEDLEEQGIIRLSHVLYLYGRLQNTNLQAGIFSVSKSMSVEELLKTFEYGRFESISVSIPEGLTISKIAKLLEDKEVTKASDFIAASKDPRLLAEFGIPSTSFEGFLFPDTYNLDPDMDGEDVVIILATNFFNKVIQIEGFPTNPEEIFQTIILASIVEREYRVTAEAPLIASVFTNRLRRDIGLYSCATLEYIITEIQGKPHPKVITYDDIQIDSPYNTYMWAGLPPTPISNPGLVALKAASNPAKTNYYYFRLIDASIGNHVFTSDFEDHIEAGISIETKDSPN